MKLNSNTVVKIKSFNIYTSFIDDTVDSKIPMIQF